MNNPVRSAGQGQKNYYNPGRVEQNTNKRCQHTGKFSTKEEYKRLLIEHGINLMNHNLHLTYNIKNSVSFPLNTLINIHFFLKSDNRTLIYFGRLKKDLIVMLFLFLISQQI